MTPYEREFPESFPTAALADLVSWLRGSDQLDARRVAAAGWNVLGFALKFLPAGNGTAAELDPPALATAALLRPELAEKLEPLAVTVAAMGGPANFDLIKPYLPFLREALKRWLIDFVDRLGS